MSEKKLYALIIGIDDYAPGSKVPPLRGCVNDARAVEAWLRRQRPDAAITTLSNEAATRESVVSNLAALAAQAQPDDLVWVHFSGHGSSTRSNDALNPAGMDESLVLWESRTEGGRDLRDKEFGALLAAIGMGGAQLCAVLDCCHAGGQTRAEVAAIRACPADLRALSAVKLPPAEVDSETAEFSALERVTILSACRDDEKAAELLPEGATLWHGAATWFLLRALEEATSATTWTLLHERISAAVRGRYARQTPQLAGPGDRLILGGVGVEERAALSILTQMVEAGLQRIQVNGGVALGVGIGTRLAIHAAGSQIAGAPLATATVVEAEASTAWATLDSPLALPITDSARVIVTAFGYENPRLRVAVDFEQLARAIANTKEPLLEFVGVAEAEVIVTRVGEDLHCVDAAGTRLLPYTFSAESVSSVRLLGALKQVAIYRNIQRLGNRAVQPVLQYALAIAPPLALAPSRSTLAAFGQSKPLARAEGGSWQIASGTRVGLVVENRHRDKLLVRVLALLPDWSIVSIEPKGTGQTTVDAGATLLVEHKIVLPEGMTQGTVLYKVFVTTEPIDFESLLLPPLLSAPLKSVTRNNSSLGWLLDALRRTGTRPTRPLAGANPDDKWYVNEVSVSVIRNS